MKKIFTLITGITIAAAAFAQHQPGGGKNDGYNKNDDMVFNNGDYKKAGNRNDNYYSSGTKERDMQVAKINREYDWKIQDVKKKYFLSRFRKEQMIRQLENQRRDEIRNVYARFSDHNNRYDDRDFRRH